MVGNNHCNNFYLSSCILSFFIIFVSFISISQCQSEDDWCEPIPLPADEILNNGSFVITPTIWWKEHYYFESLEYVNMVFKVYPNATTDTPIGLYTVPEICPQPFSVALANYTIDYALNYPIVLHIPVKANSRLMILVRVIGSSYTLMACKEGFCNEVCPSDCNQHGFCDFTSRVCTCYDGWNGDGCLAPPRKPPHGSGEAFYIVVVGIPAVVFIIIASVVAFLIIRKRNKVVPILQLNGDYTENGDETPRYSQNGEDVSLLAKKSLFSE